MINKSILHKHIHNMYASRERHFGAHWEKKLFPIKFVCISKSFNHKITGHISPTFISKKSSSHTNWYFVGLCIDYYSKMA